MTTKSQRQHHIARLLTEHEVTSQPQLVELLATTGIAATQATVSRDLEDLGAVKVRLPGGELAYAIPEYEPDRLAPHDHLRRVLGEWVAEVAQSGNLDTMLCVASERVGGARLAKTLRGLASLSNPREDDR